MQRIGVIGAGAWGTALAAMARRAGRDVVLWAREEEVVEGINASHVNEAFLPEVALDPEIRATGDYAEAVDADLVLLVAPAQHLRTVCAELAPHWKGGVPAVICSKGIEKGSKALMTQVIIESLPAASPMVLSGPTFAKEVAAGLPTAVTLACEDGVLGQRAADAIGTATFRPYLSKDLVGAAIGGAVKNVLAIACGLVEGKQLGDNARAALITRGLVEVVRLALSLGGQSQTLMGLCGLGDLLLTATSIQSRNYSLGVALGQGRTLDEVLGARRAVTEGVHTAEAVVALAVSKGVDMPICYAMDQILNRGVAVDEAIHELLDRPIKEELDFS
ncbi:MAG: NAD(P)-dependent glycerol-3-phosphate dehydrogenase [Rhodospirillaceae bacterium]|nr:NAD(P)-dependent glycerol-3-phosphate dehydrogenase [Rhodospirillaceae bacterium]